MHTKSAQKSNRVVGLKMFESCIFQMLSRAKCECKYSRIACFTKLGKYSAVECKNMRQKMWTVKWKKTKGQKTIFKKQHRRMQKHVLGE